MSSQKGDKYWCFTWNNYSEAQLDNMKTDMQKRRVKYYVMGREVGESGTPHIQGYVVFENNRTFNGITRQYKNGIHWEIRKGTHQQARDYCKKDNKFEEWGTEPAQQGARSDLTKIKDDILNGKTVDDLCLENPMLYHQYGRTLNKIEDLRMRKLYRTEMTKGIWYYGKTGVGKSHIAFEGFNPSTHYEWKSLDNKWWDGYTQQETVIINDFRGEIKYNDLLQLVDKWPYSVPRRGREPMPFISKKVIITSSLHPTEVYKNRNLEDSLEQLLRRFDIIEIQSKDI